MSGKERLRHCAWEHHDPAIVKQRAAESYLSGQRRIEAVCKKYQLRSRPQLEQRVMCNRKRVHRLMRILDLRSVCRRKKRTRRKKLSAEYLAEYLAENTWIEALQQRCSKGAPRKAADRCSRFLCIVYLTGGRFSQQIQR